jgi:hypothetical protein
MERPSRMAFEETATRAAQEYLATLDEAAFGAGLV